MARRDLTGAVDFAYLETYAGGDQQVVDEVLALFREQASLWSRLLEPGADPGVWRDAVHTLKGSARGIGANALAEVCAVAEAACIAATLSCAVPPSRRKAATAARAAFSASGPWPNPSAIITAAAWPSPAPCWPPSRPA